MKEKLPNAFVDAERRLYDILLRSKLGQRVSDDEYVFAEMCWKKWPNDYARLRQDRVQPEAFRRVNPLI